MERKLTLFVDCRQSLDIRVGFSQFEKYIPRILIFTNFSDLSITLSFEVKTRRPQSLISSGNDGPNPHCIQRVLHLLSDYLNRFLKSRLFLDFEYFVDSLFSVVEVVPFVSHKTIFGVDIDIHEEMRFVSFFTSERFLSFLFLKSFNELFRNIFFTNSLEDFV